MSKPNTATAAKGALGAAAKKTAKVKVLVFPDKATPSPPIGPKLGAFGVNLGLLCKQLNDATRGRPADIRIPVIVTIYPDRSFSFELKTPAASDLIRHALKLPKGSANPNKDKVGRLTLAQLEEIARLKISDTTAASLRAAMRSIAGTARSMGVDTEVVA